MGAQSELRGAWEDLRDAKGALNSGVFEIGVCLSKSGLFGPLKVDFGRVPENFGLPMVCLFIVHLYLFTHTRLAFNLQSLL